MSIGKFVDFKKLDEPTKILIKESIKARGFSYSPYSKFAVGSALRCADGTIRTGCNVENASFSVTLCAERCALGKAVSEGQQNFISISVAANKIDGRLTSPCGMCRQMLSEFGDFPVYITSPELDSILVTSTYELLPYGFRKGSQDNFSSPSSKEHSDNS